jgi:predicted DsbA family dithiol-disulfide isomerase
LTVTILLSSLLNAASTKEKIADFLEESFSNNPNIVSLKVTIADVIEVKSMKGWSAYIVKVDAMVKAKPENRNIKQKMIYFSNGEVITPELTNMKSGKSLKESVSPEFKPEFYTKSNLIYGNANAKHKVAIFSDPLCPYCRTFVPEAIKYMKKYPNKFAIYYYHFPLPSIHPAAVELTQAAAAAELKGTKDVILKLYKVKVDAREKNVQKIVTAFNKELGTKLTPADLKSLAVTKHLAHDAFVADEVMVGGTPTMFFDGKLDRTKKKYKTVK